MPHSLPVKPLSSKAGQTLLCVARQALEAAANGRHYPEPDTDPDLREPTACFVTLNKQGQLRGCIGSLEAHQPLIESVIKNTFSAALSDPRFPPVEADEVDAVDIEISVLTNLQPVQFDSEQQLLEQLRPFTDGLVMQKGARRATFLPSVWKQLPDKQEFLRQLKKKAGLAEDYWSDNIKAYRYQAQILTE